MSDLFIGNTSIRQLDGLYNLNDLHKLSGGEPRHKAHNFLRLDQTKELAEEILKANTSALNQEVTAEGSDLRLATNPIKTKQGGKDAGTFACRELVYAYAMWISPKFSLAVIRAFDQMQNHPAQPVPSDTKTTLPVLAQPVAIDDREIQTVVTVMKPGEAPIVKMYQGKITVVPNREILEYIGVVDSRIKMDAAHIEAQLKFLHASSMIEETKH